MTTIVYDFRNPRYNQMGTIDYNTGGAPSGTWECCGLAFDDGTVASRSTLFRRIA